MLYLLPLGIFVLALLVAGVIVVQKFPYLKRLSPDVIDASTESQSSMAHDLLPFVSTYWERLDFPRKKVALMSELEKILRKFRLLFLRIEHSMVRVIDALRRRNLRHVEAIAEDQDKEEKDEVPVVHDPILALRQREQLLIMSIAKDPKNPRLYDELGDVFLELNEIGDARQSYQTTLQLEPENEIVRKKIENLID